jgi:hypothetical protein
MVFRYVNRPLGGSSSSAFYDFTLGSLPAGVSLTRASAGYRRNSSGVLVSETTNVARFDYTPVTLAARGILVESAGTNLLTYSEDFSNAAWTKTQSTITADAVAAPDGTTTADALVENSAATVAHNLARVVTYAASTTYVHSVYAKQDTRTWLWLYLDPGMFGGSGFAYFNLATGATGTVGAGITAYMTLEANGFYRCVAIAATTSSGGANFAIGLATGDGGAVYTGDGVSKAYIWGANVVAESAVTSYIQTVAATATRAADVATITNASAISDQCWIIRARTPIKLAAGAANTIFQVDNGGNSRRTVYYLSGVLTVLVQNASVTQCSINTAAVANDTDFTIAMRFADNNFAVSLNGGAIVTDLSGTNPVGLTTARIGTISSGGFAWNSTIKTIETRRTASDTELPLLSA